VKSPPRDVHAGDELVERSENRRRLHRHTKMAPRPMTKMAANSSMAVWSWCRRLPRDDAGDLLVEQVELPLALLADGGKVLGIVGGGFGGLGREQIEISA